MSAGNSLVPLTVLALLGAMAREPKNLPITDEAPIGADPALPVTGDLPAGPLAPGSVMGSVSPYCGRSPLEGILGSLGLTELSQSPDIEDISIVERSPENNDRLAVFNFSFVGGPRVYGGVLSRFLNGRGKWFWKIQLPPPAKWTSPKPFPAIKGCACHPCPKTRKVVEAAGYEHLLPESLTAKFWLAVEGDTDEEITTIEKEMFPGVDGKWFTVEDSRGPFLLNEACFYTEKEACAHAIDLLQKKCDTICESIDEMNFRLGQLDAEYECEGTIEDLRAEVNELKDALTDCGEHADHPSYVRELVAAYTTEEETDETEDDE